MSDTLTRTTMNIRCLCCGTTDGTRRLDLDDLKVITCSECDQDFSTDDLRENVADAHRLLKWIDAAGATE